MKKFLALSLALSLQSTLAYAGLEASNIVGYATCNPCDESMLDDEYYNSEDLRKNLQNYEGNEDVLMFIVNQKKENVAKGNYKKGKRDGEHVIYDSNGNVKKTILYKNGKIVCPTDSLESFWADGVKDCSVCGKYRLNAPGGFNAGSTCVPLYCPWKKVLRSSHGTCLSCDTEAAVNVYKINSNCSYCSNREISNNACVLKTAKPCYGISDCPNGYFCNYGGGGYSYGTPDRCEKTNPEKVVIDGTTYYYPSKQDLFSWCRGADAGNNCIWGFLSYYGAHSWCQSIGKKLASSEEVIAHCSDFQKIASIDQYWVDGQTTIHMDNKCTPQYMGRTDGYAWAGGVICK